MPDSKEILTISQEDPFVSEGAMLIEELDHELNSRYPGSSVHGLHPEDTRSGRLIFLVARQNGEPVGCGALRFMDDGMVEIKRMFVRPAFRRRGIAYNLLSALETKAVDLKLQIIRLEAGYRQPEAISFYKKNGYYPIDCYGEYETDPHSLCFEKKLSGSLGDIYNQD